MAGTGTSSGGNGCTCGQRGQRNSTHSSYNYSILSPVMITVSHSLSPLPSLPHSAVHHLLDWHRLLSGYIKWNLKQRCSKNTCVCKMSYLPESSISVFDPHKQFSFLSALLKLDLQPIKGWGWKIQNMERICLLFRADAWRDWKLT